MKKIYYLLLIIFLSVGCSTVKKIDALKPEPAYDNTVFYQKQESYITVPLEISTDFIQSQVNKYLNGLVYEDNNMEGDNLELKIYKQSPISITENSGKIELALPLKINGKFRYGIQKFGISAYDTREFSMNGTFRISSLIGFNNWQLSSSTNVGKVDWLEEPTVNIAGKSITVTSLLNTSLNIFKPKIANSIDETIKKTLDIKTLVTNMLESFCKPVEVNKDYHVWLSVVPYELISSNAVIANKKIAITLGMKANIETAINSKPTIVFDKTKINFSNNVVNLGNFECSVAGIVTYEGAASLMQQNFEGKIFGEGKKSIKVKSLNLWGRNNKVVLALETGGAVNGMIYLNGTPVYDSAKKEVYLDQLDFVLDTKNKLLKVGDWIAHGLILKKIQENCHYSLAGQLTESTALVNKFMNNNEPAKGVRLNGTLNSLTPQKINLTPGAITQFIKATGKLSVVLTDK